MATFPSALRSAAFRQLCFIAGLNSVVTLACVGAPPGLPIEDLRGIPPSGQSFRQWTERQRIAGWAAAQAAPGGEINVVQSYQPVRVPFFVVSVKDSPADFVQNESAIIGRLKERIFGGQGGSGDSLQGYYNQLFNGKLSFFDSGDFIPLDLPGTLADYFIGMYPRRKLFLALKEALSHTAVPLEVYNNKQLTGEANDPTHAQDLIDLSVIFVLGRSNQRNMWPLRSWYEWTSDNGPAMGNVDVSASALPIPDPKTHKILKLSNYCIMPIFGPNGDDVIGNGFLAHEMLHAFGLPDLYDRNGRTGGCGGWCCMSWGMYGGMDSAVPPLRYQWGGTPVWVSAWCRKFLTLDGEGIRKGWRPSEGDAQLVSPLYGSNDIFCRIDLPPHEVSDSNTQRYERYLLIELRGPGLQRNGAYDWDQQLPRTGFLIWEVNEDVGRRDPLGGSELNVFWPCDYGGKGQNDDNNHPLVGLWRPGSTALTNLSSNALLQKEQLWSEDTQIFTHPDGVVLSHFAQNNKVGTFHYRIERKNLPAATATLAPTSTPVTVTQFKSSSVGNEVIGTPETVSSKLPTEVNQRLKHVYAAYPSFDHAITTQGDDVKALALPTKVNSRKAFTKDVLSHLDLLNGRALGDSRAKIIVSATRNDKAARTSWTNLFKGNETVPKDIGVQIGDNVVRVSGTYLDVQHTPEEEGRVRYFISESVNTPDLPQTVHTTISKAEVMKFLQDRFQGKIPKDVPVELVVENGTGKLKWQCRWPTVPTSGPVTIEIDANDPKGLSTETAMTVK
jgi:M6 family metalloprotease-like protein